MIRSIPENMGWRYFGADGPPVAEVNGGDVVEIQTISISGINRDDPMRFFNEQGIALNLHTEEMQAISSKAYRP